MAITYTYTITEIVHEDVVNNYGETLPDAITNVYWRCTGVDDTDSVTGIMEARMPLPTGDTRLADFVAFSSVTETDVINWVKAVWPTDSELVVGSEIANKQAESYTTDLPWDS